MICTSDETVSTNPPRWEKMLRRPKLGPELDLVQSFFNEDGIPSAPEGQEITVFFEPKIDSGFPDLVAVYWDKNTLESWPEERLSLTRSDVRLAQYLYVIGHCDRQFMVDEFGRSVCLSLERLVNAGMVGKKEDTFALQPIEEIFAIRRLIALEAKMADWQEGLIQAVQNTWFASESYLLLPSMPKSKQLSAQASTLGIGLVTLDIPVDYCEPLARREMLPQSHGCWIFNEWLMRIHR